MLEVVRAVELLYALDERDLVVPFVADLADKAPTSRRLAMLAEIAEKNDDARSVLLIGKAALGRGFAFDQYAFPTGGLPRYSAIAPEVEPARGLLDRAPGKRVQSARPSRARRRSA